MVISDLQPKQGNVNLIIEVVSKEEPRNFEKFGRAGRVCNAIAKDHTGEIKLTLWNEQIDQVNVGDMVEIKNGYVNEWQGEKQLSTGRLGKIIILEKAKGKKDDDEKKTVYTNDPEKLEKMKEDQIESMDEAKEEHVFDEEEIE